MYLYVKFFFSTVPRREPVTAKPNPLGDLLNKLNAALGIGPKTTTTTTEIPTTEPWYDDPTTEVYINEGHNSPVSSIQVG